MNTIVSKILAAVPNPSPVAPPGVGEKVLQLLGWLKWGGLVAVVAGFIVVGAVMIFENRGGQGGESAKRVMYVAIGAIIIGSAASLAAFLTGA